MLLVSGLCVVLAGCQRTEVVFINDLDRDVQVTLDGPGDVKPDQPLPVSRNGQALYVVNTPTSELPANYRWQAGDQMGSVVIESGSPNRVTVHITRARPEQPALGYEP